MAECSYEDEKQPFSFKEFLRKNPSIESRDDKVQYNGYLVSWFEAYYSDDDTDINEDFKQILKRLFILFKDDPIFEEFGKIDFDGDVEMKILLPIFAQKLKKIALYFSAKRESIKKIKLHHNTVGSLQSIEASLYEYLLKNYTKREPLNSVMGNKTVLDSILEFADVKDNFSVKVEDLYSKE